MLTARAKKLTSWLLKAGILLFAFTYIYRQLTNKNDLHNFRQLISHVNTVAVWVTLTVVVIFMLINWVLESFKWKYLTRRLHPITAWQAIEGVFCGLTFAIFTPNRLGEYGGRVMYLPPRKRIYGVFAMAVGSFGQNVVTNVVGAGAILWFLYQFQHLQSWLFVGVAILVVGFMLFFILFYFNIRWLAGLLNSIKPLKKFHRFFDIMRKYRLAELTRVMGFCLARFAVFSTQYYFVVHLLIPEIPAYQTYLFVFIVFFVQSALPSIDLLDIGVRTATADTLFAYVTHQHLAAIAAVASIWFINLIVPAVLGSVFVLKLKFFDNNV
ncbi:lysylphosphatidylglycerol synthase domain-containing protein [Mucilaginibacter sp.]